MPDSRMTDLFRARLAERKGATVDDELAAYGESMGITRRAAPPMPGRPETKGPPQPTRRRSDGRSRTAQHRRGTARRRHRGDAEGRDDGQHDGEA